MTPDAVDLSNNNGNVDCAAVARAGVKVIVSKCAEGVGGTHSTFAANWTACGALVASGALQRRGAYHFARADQGTAVQNAQAAVNAVGTMSGHDFIALDVEAPSVNHPWPLPAGAASVQWVLDCLNELERLTGRVPWLYCSLGFIQGVLASNALLSRFPLWIADIDPISQVPTPWPYALWQYTWTASIPGVNGPVDGSRFGPAYPQTIPEDPVTPAEQQAVADKVVAALQPAVRDIVRQELVRFLGADGAIPPLAKPTVMEAIKHYAADIVAKLGH